MLARLVHHPGSGLAALVVAAAGASGVILAWFVHALVHPHVDCDFSYSSAPGGCSGPSGFTSWAVGGAVVGLLVGVLGVVALARSLRD